LSFDNNSQNWQGAILLCLSETSMKVSVLASILFGCTIASSVVDIAIASPNHHADSTHHHRSVSVPDHALVPNVTLELTPDTQKGWNLHIITENFDFAPETVNQDSNVNAGHAHLYLNGEKVTRLYSHWYYISELASGTHTLTITLNTNRHEDIVHQGQPVQASVTVTVP
jgi:hypothetical protein